MADTGKALPKAQAHKGHGSLISKTSFGSSETRFDSEGNRIDGYLTIEGATGRRRMFKDSPAQSGGAY